MQVLVLEMAEIDIEENKAVEVQLKMGDWIGIRKGKFEIIRNNAELTKETYAPGNCKIKSFNDIQQKVIELLQPKTTLKQDLEYVKSFKKDPVKKSKTLKNPMVVELDRELKQLISIDRLKKALTRHFSSIEQLKGLSDDDALLKRRRISKYKNTLKKYLNQLKQDTNFNLNRLDNAIKLSYSGRYVKAVKVVVL